MKSFEFFAAKDSNDALTLLAQHAANAKVKIIAGGTDLLADLKFAAHGPDVVVDISRADDLKNITITEQDLGKPTHFLKFGLRKGQALALVNVAASVWVDWEKHAFLAPRIALGAVAPKVIRAPQAEAYLEGRTISPEAMAEAGRIAVGDAKPISDFRASAEYRRHLVAVLTKRALESAWTLAQTRRL